VASATNILDVQDVVSIVERNNRTPPPMASIEIRGIPELFAKLGSAAAMLYEFGLYGNYSVFRLAVATHT
jgi:hypothetical protein